MKRAALVVLTGCLLVALWFFIGGGSEPEEGSPHQQIDQPGAGDSKPLARTDATGEAATRKPIEPGKPVPSGCVVTGIVRDPSGVPVANVVLWLRREGADPAARSRVINTAKDGTFAVGKPCVPGRWMIRSSPPRKLVGPTEFAIDAGVDKKHLDVTVEALAPGTTIDGVLVDEAEKPIAGVTLSVKDSSGQRKSSVQTKANGSFQVVRHASHQGNTLTFATGHNMGSPDSAYELVDSKSIRWGTTGVRLRARLRTAQDCSFDLRVVNAETGAPVEGFGLRFYDVSPGAVYPPAHEHSSRNSWNIRQYDGGHVKFDNVVAARHTLSVYPSDRSLAPAGLERLEFAPREVKKHVVKLFRRRTLAVTVLAGGAPVAGARVQLILHRGPGDLTLKTRAWPVEAVFDGSSGLVYSEGATNARGQITLTGRPSTTPYFLRLPGPKHPGVHEAGLLQQDSALTIHVASGTSLRVTFGPEDAWNSLFGGRNKPRVYLVEERTNKPWPPAGGPNPLFLAQAKPYVDIPGIPNGTYRMHMHRSLGGSNFVHELEPRFVIDAPGPRTAEVDIRHLMPGSVSGRAFLNGKPMDRGQIQLIPASVWQQTGTAWLRYVFTGRRISTDEEGRIQKIRLPMGEYRAVHGRLVGREPIPVRADQAIDVQIQFQSTKLTLKILDAAGKPAANRACRVMLPFWLDMRTDAKGLLVLEQAPRTGFKLLLWDEISTTRGAWQIARPHARENDVEVQVDPPASADPDKPLVVRLPRGP